MEKIQRNGEQSVEENKVKTRDDSQFRRTRTFCARAPPAGGRRIRGWPDKSGAAPFRGWRRPPAARRPVCASTGSGGAPGSARTWPSVFQTSFSPPVVANKTKQGKPRR